jgi:hypothetical protein
MTSLSSTQKGKKNLGESISKNNNNNKISYSISHTKKKKNPLTCLTTSPEKQEKAAKP